MKKVQLLCELRHIETQEANTLFAYGLSYADYRERQMSYEFDRSYIEEIIMLSALTLFLVLAVAIPA